MACPACGVAGSATARFCDQCGAPLRHARLDATGDRRIVTALFADLVDYVRMVAEHDPEDVRRQVDAALAAMAEAVERYGGSTEKFIGDAVFAVFGHPRGHGDDALRAALCAAAIRQELADLSRGREPLRVRIGIATGEVVAGPRRVGDRTETSLTGPAVVTAARIQYLARPDEVLVDEATVRAARDRLIVEDRGAELLRGQLQPVRIYALVGRPSVVRSWQRPLGRTVGRHDDRARLREALADVARIGRGRIVGIRGEAGIGKTRLMSDLEADARAARFAWTWTECVSYGTGEPYRFVRHFAQTIADEHGVDSGSFVRRLVLPADLDPDDARRVAGAVAAIARDASFSGWEAEAAYAPTDPAEAVRALLEVADRYLRRLAALHGPRVIVVDDAHWIDASSEPMLEHLLALTPELPYLVLVGSRPNRPGEPAGPAGSAAVEWLELAGLGPDETDELVANLAGVALSRAETARLHERTGGNPLFVTELVRARLEATHADAGEGPPMASEVARGTADVPLTLRSLIGARIDNLPDDERAALQVASVVGIVFAAPLVGALLDRELRPATLRRLADAAFLVAGGDGETWRFGHPLVHEVAYASLLATRRRSLHATLADELERRGTTAIGRIAAHRAAAGDRERAVPLLLRAAEEAVALGAVAEAARFWRTAADLSEPVEADRLRALAAAVGAAAPSA